MLRLLPILFAIACATADAGSFYGAGSGGGGSTITQAAYASCGSGLAAGDICRTTDSPVTSRVWDGSAWDDCIDGYGCADPIATSGWAAGGTSHTLSTAGGVRSLQAAGGAATGGHLLTVSPTSWRATALISMFSSDTTTTDASILFGMQENSTSDALLFAVNALDGGTSGHVHALYALGRPNGFTSEVSQVLRENHEPFFGLSGRFWLRVGYDAANVGTEITLQISRDGISFEAFHTAAVGTDFTGTPDRLVFAVVGASGAPTLTTMYLLEIEDLD